MFRLVDRIYIQEFFLTSRPVCKFKALRHLQCRHIYMLKSSPGLAQLSSPGLAQVDLVMIKGLLVHIYNRKGAIIYIKPLYPSGS